MNQSQVTRIKIPSNIIRLAIRSDTDDAPQFVPVEEMGISIGEQRLEFQRYSQIFQLHETLELRVSFHAAYNVESHTVYYYLHDSLDNFHVIDIEGI